MTSPCPSNSFTYNTSQCACNPGYLYTSGSCRLFTVSGSDWVIGAPVDDSLKFPETILSFDLIKKFTQSQALFLEVTAFMVATWLAFCLFVRFRKLGDGRSKWFQIRWWISRWDICFSTRHWLDDQKVVKKRKTELGGTFSVASWILFIGLFAALLFQNISGRTVEIQNMRGTNSPELASFKNDLEFNITTISNMSCLNLRNLGTLVAGNPGFADYRISPLTTFANYSCQNSSQGPIISLKCKNCQIIRDSAYISWQFVDLPNNPATAVGFQFNLTSKNHDSNKHVSFVGGLLRNGSIGQEKPVTYRGAVPNVLKFNLFPRIYRNLHNLKLIRPFFHEFIPGSSYSEISQLQTSLQSSANGLVNITLDINFLSAYIVEIDNQNTIGPVRFLADLGGLYCISIVIFFYLLVQCEYRVKKLRNEDTIMRRIRNRKKSQDNWDKLRKYVMYTWGCKAMDDTEINSPQEVCCARFMVQSLPKNGSSMKQRQPNGTDTISISFNRKIKLPDAKKVTVDASCSKDKVIAPSKGSKALRNEKDVSKAQGEIAIDDCLLPSPPTLELKENSDVTMSDIKKTFQNMYDYNLLLRKKLIDTHSELQCLTRKASSSGLEK